MSFSFGQEIRVNVLGLRRLAKLVLHVDERVQVVVRIHAAAATTARTAAIVVVVGVRPWRCRPRAASRQGAAAVGTARQRRPPQLRIERAYPRRLYVKGAREGEGS